MANEPNLKDHISTVDFYDFTKMCYEVYGAYVNNFRAIPSALDGLKPVQRRVIYTAMMDTGHKKTSELAASTMKHHPHGSSSIEPVCNFLKRKGILDGHGQFGATMMNGNVIKPSAGRYTSCWINPVYYKLFNKLIKYAPAYLGEFGLPQPHFIPTPVPLALTLGGFGIGIGCNFSSPMFTAESLLEAYLANDYTLLEPPKGYGVNKAELKDLWEGDAGRVTYTLSTEKDFIDGKPGLAIVGGTEVFTPYIDEDMKRWINEGRVYMNDYTDKTQNKLVFARAPRVTWPNEEDVFNKVRQMAVKSISYRIKCCYAGTVYRIGIRDWIDITYNNYLHMYDLYKQDQLDKLNHAIPIYENFSQVAQLLIQHKTDKEIISKLKIEPWIVSEIAKKTLRTLQSLNPKAKLDQIHKNIEAVKALSGSKFVEDTFLKHKDTDLSIVSDEEGA